MIGGSIRQQRMTDLGHEETLTERIVGRSGLKTDAASAPVRFASALMSKLSCTSVQILVACRKTHRLIATRAPDISRNTASRSRRLRHSRIIGLWGDGLGAYERDH